MVSVIDYRKSAETLYKLLMTVIHPLPPPVILNEVKNRIVTKERQKNIPLPPSKGEHELALRQKNIPLSPSKGELTYWVRFSFAPGTCCRTIPTMGQVSISAHSPHVAKPLASTHLHISHS